LTYNKSRRKIELDCKSQESGKYTNYTESEIKEYLEELKKLIQRGQYSVSPREENDSFAANYRIDTEKEKEILLNLNYKDFCYAVANRKPEYSYERLYVFCKEYELDNWGSIELVNIYIKTNLMQTRSGKDFVVVISFHKLNKPIKHLFI